MLVLKGQAWIIHYLSQIWQHCLFLHFKAGVFLWIHCRNTEKKCFWNNVLLSLSGLGIKIWNWTTLIRIICWGTDKTAICLRYYVKLSFSLKASVVMMNVFGFREFPVDWCQFISLWTLVGHLSWAQVVYLQRINHYSQ